MNSPAVDTLIEGEIDPLLHSKEPVKPEAVNSELPQSSTTVTVGVATSELSGAAFPLPAILVHPFTV